ncbi:hypothetical protein G210_4295 [Candida maltosa Xu316]|uniref:SCP domain-containing protein n=1 Tax=Candida maltosa (strain Xu316) TaxID=1245528 RepID=M3JT78_CANMX|nr:hypothetical protein G210_4295 [Candida maltosa Xu316]
MKFSHIATTAAIAGLANSAVVYITKTNEYTKYATITGGAEQTVQVKAVNTQAVESIETTEPTTEATGQAEPTTWVFSTNILGNDIVFTSVLNGNEAGSAVRTLYEEHVIVKQGNSASTQTLVVQANPSTLVTSTVQQGETTSVSAEVQAPVTSESTQATTSIAAETAPVAKAAQTPSTTSSSTSAAAPTTSSTSVAATTPSASATSGSSGSGSGDFSGVQDEDFAKAILDAHNVKRAIHSAPPLSWDPTVYQYAQAYADQYDCSGNLKHSGGKYGENLGVGFPDGPSVVTAWYNEAGTDGKDYDYGSATDYNHFTQLVWKSTTKLGCAYKTCGVVNGVQLQKYIVCSYDPAGNVIGTDQKTGKSYMAENVLPPN